MMLMLLLPSRHFKFQCCAGGASANNSDDEDEREEQRKAKRWEKRARNRSRLAENEDSQSRGWVFEEDEESQSLLRKLKVYFLLCYNFATHASL
jgi:hypothetical protein